MTEGGGLDPTTIALSFTRLLDELGIRHVVGGSFASSVHGEPRSTNDIDIGAELSLERIPSFVDSVASDYYVSKEAVREAVTLAGSFNVIHYAAGMKVDVFVAGSDPFEQERLRVCEHVQVGAAPGATIAVDLAEHSVLRKLEWYRRGGESSDRQWLDVVAILRVQSGRLDRSRLDKWAAVLGVADLLERAFAEVLAD